MNQMKTVASWALLTVAVVAVAGFVVSKTDAPAAAAEEAAARPGVLARVGDLEITEAEVEAVVASQLMQLRQQRHQAIEQGLEQLVSQRLLEAEAASRGISVAQLVQAEIIDKVGEPTDAEVDAFYEGRQLKQPKEQIAPQIRRYLVQQRQEARQEELLEALRGLHGATTYLEPFRVEVAEAGSPANGPEDAPVTLIEFSDFQCPYCARVAPTLSKVKQVYADKVRVVFRQFPLHSLHPNAQKAAEASLCADEQERFWDMHDTMFKEQSALGVPQLKEKAARLELDVERFNECLDSSRFADRVAADLAAGQAVGVSGTPALFINGRFLNGAQPFETIAKVIDEELARATQAN